MWAWWLHPCAKLQPSRCCMCPMRAKKLKRQYTVASEPLTPEISAEGRAPYLWLTRLLLYKIVAAILDFRGQRVQSDLVQVKCIGSGSMLRKLLHCTPNSNRMAPFSVQLVKHALGCKSGPNPILWRVALKMTLFGPYRSKFHETPQKCPQDHQLIATCT